MPISNPTFEPPSPPLRRGFVRLRLDLAYDGTNYAGWGIQPDLRTVQSTVQEVVGLVLRLGGPASTFVAGRTDAGVHARGQVVHVDVPESTHIDFYRNIYSINGILPADIRLRAMTYAPEGFDARFSADARRYTYSIADTIADPITRNHVVGYWLPMNVAALNEASAKLIGVHDFTTFCRRSALSTSIRDLQIFSWERTDFGVKATIQADAFCHTMVRSLVGALVPVGDGREDVDFPRRALEARDRLAQVVTMPAHGLVLEEVLYPPDDQLQARQDITRARRELMDVD